MIPLPDNSALQPAHTVPIKKEEAREQARLVAGLRFCWSKIPYNSLRPVVFHIANGGSRDAREASNLKVQGFWPACQIFALCCQKAVSFGLR